ncbi:alpha/beta fold hydrolase [Acuticoccus yangtzensis]|uniref:alpha/beta fold hydrolase n=1 Tax=Acuticoccus yangtzensis TaxID=1443441 RepID=UPI0009498F40|nr:alpha/beta hydrolase [Acuticoccus yangtzensis]
MPIADINNHKMYYETHGGGDPLILMGGWGSFCHGEEKHLPIGLLERHKVVLLDYRGIGESEDDHSVPSSTRLYAEDAVALMDHLGIDRFHMVGLIGMGACIGQEIAATWPERVRSLVNTGAWLKADRFLADQLNVMTEVHRDLGFLAFQRLVTVMSFEPAYYAKNIDRLTGPDGVWHHINGRIDTHLRFVNACLTHDMTDRAGSITAPTFVLHAHMDQVTGPRTTLPIEQAIPNATGYHMKNAAHVIAGKEQKIEFGQVLCDFLSKH